MTFHGSLCYIVSKTTKELLLEWDNAQDQLSVSVAKDLKMPQFEMQKITTNKCHEENHMGEYCIRADLFYKYYSKYAVFVAIHFN